jgi:hypothetical protein
VDHMKNQMIGRLCLVVVFAVVLAACGYPRMKNEDAIRVTHYCESNGMEAHALVSAGLLVDIQCMPKETK